MNLVHRIFGTLFQRRRVAAGGAGKYGAEVLFAGWVELPKSFREIIARR
jgi:hypothetical protein